MSTSFSKTSKPPIQSTKKIRRLLLQLLMGMLGAALFLSLSWSFYLRNQPPQIATVDVTSMIQRFVETMADARLPKNQLQKRVNDFGQVLENTLKAVAEDKQLVLLPKEAVISGVKDISDEVERIIHAKWEVHSNKLPHSAMEDKK